MQKIEEIALSKLIRDDNYCRSVLPFLKDEYFDNQPHQVLFHEINDYVTEYNQIPETTALKIEIEKRRDLSAEIIKDIEDFLDTKIDDTTYNEEWLYATTEKWCKERAIYLALMESIKIADGQDKSRTKDAIPHIMAEALGTCFDDTVGHDYLLYSDDRYDFYHKQEDKLPFDLEYLNKITKGGLPSKTLTSLLLERVSGKVYSCAIWLVPPSCKARTYSILHLKWQRRRLLNELTQTSWTLTSNNSPIRYSPNNNSDPK